jgi:predicted enzyme related to lactoylglutathione lyase
MSQNNTICWTDIPVADLDRAIRFYSDVLGTTVTKESMPGMEIGLLPHANENVSGCLVKSEDNRRSEHGPLVYLSVEGRLDQAIQAAQKGGGKVLQPKHPIGPYGFRAVIRDTEGNRIALHSH